MKSFQAAEKFDRTTALNRQTAPLSGYKNMMGRWSMMRMRGLRIILVIGLLLLNTTLVYLVVQRQYILVLYLLMGGGLVLTFLRWPALGLVAAIVSGVFVPLLGRSGFNLTAILIALLLGLWLLDIVVRHRRIQVVPSRTVWPMICFIIVALFSFGVGQLPWFAFAPHAPLGAQLGGLAIILLSASTFLVVAHQLQELTWLSTVTWAFIAVAVLAIIIGAVLPKLGLPTRRLIQPVGSVYYIWVVAIAFSQAVFNRNLHTAWRLVLGGLVLYTLFDLFFMRFENKSGWVPALACIGAIIGFRSWRAGLLMVPAAALFAFYFGPKFIATDEYSISTRFDALLIMAQIIKINPLWGVGFANYYWYTPLFPIRGYSVKFNSHNNFVDIIAQTGFVGLACLWWFFWEAAMLGFRLREKAPAGFPRAYVYGVLGGLVGTVVAGMFGDWVLPFFYNIGLGGFRTSMLAWLFLGGLVSLEQMVLSPKVKIQ